MFYLNALGMICALGRNLEGIKSTLLDSQKSGVEMTQRYSTGRPVALGQADFELPWITHLPLKYRSRANQLALAALSQIKQNIDSAIDKYGADRIAIVIGTSASGIAESEAAIKRYILKRSFPDNFHYEQQELGSPASMLAATLGVKGPVYVHSSACTSSAKAMASAARLLKMNSCDAVITGGVDSLSAYVVSGFLALESVSAKRCNPLSVNRCGINLGEGAALFLMTRESAKVALKGWGESSDGYHISAPDPEGKGAKIAIEKALKRAGITAGKIDYINMHGTGTIQNDLMESKVILALFGDGTLVSSTKSMTGHTLGAAGAIEAGLCWIVMQDDNVKGRVPPHIWDGKQDPLLPNLNVAEPGSALGRNMQWCLSSSFAFGGSNAVLVLGKE